MSSIQSYEVSKMVSKRGYQKGALERGLISNRRIFVVHNGHTCEWRGEPMSLGSSPGFKQHIFANKNQYR